MYSSMCEEKKQADSVVDALVKTIDCDTRYRLPTDNRLLLLGNEDSVFLRNVHCKAKVFGIPCDLTTHPVPPYAAVVVDNQSHLAGYDLPKEADIDCVHTPGLSCVALAVLTVLLHQNLVYGKNITIVGRGHAAQGLAQALEMNHATVTVAHSQTPDMFKATAGRDVVVYATPTLTQEIAYDTTGLVIDLGNVVPHSELLDCPYLNRIGKLTVSILLNRLARMV